MIYPDDGTKWWQRPLPCVFGFHKFRTHPGMWWWQYCTRCMGERNTLS